MSESKSVLSKYWISTHVSQRPIPTPLGSPTSFVMSDFTGKGSNDRNADSTLADAASLQFLFVLELSEQEMLKVFH